jgi:hypothetical protein
VKALSSSLRVLQKKKEKKEEEAYKSPLANLPSF